MRQTRRLGVGTMKTTGARLKNKGKFDKAHRLRLKMIKEGN